MLSAKISFNCSLNYHVCYEGFPEGFLHDVCKLSNISLWPLSPLNSRHFALQYAGENLLRESGASYTIVRPGGLTNDEPGKYKLQAGKKSCLFGSLEMRHFS